MTSHVEYIPIRLISLPVRINSDGATAARKPPKIREEEVLDLGSTSSAATRPWAGHVYYDTGEQGRNQQDDDKA